MLNVQGNKLKAVPPSIGNLASLQSLILQGTIVFFPPALSQIYVFSYKQRGLWKTLMLLFTANDLRGLPPEVGNLKSLRTLNISENSNLPGVPPTLARVRTLEVK